MIHTKSLVVAASLSLFAFSGFAIAQDTGTEERKKDGAGEAIDAKALLEKVKKKYAAFTDYSCTIKQQQPMGMMNITSNGAIKYKRAGKYHLEMTQSNPMGGAPSKMMGVSDGAKAFLYIGQMNQYLEMPAGSPPALPGAAMLIGILDGNEQGTAMLAGAKATKVTVGDKTIERLSTTAMGATISFDFDATSGLLLKFTQAIKVSKDSPNPQIARMAPMLQQMGINEIRTIAAYSDIKTNQGLKDELFVFKAPEGATKTTPGALRRGMGGMGGMGGGGARRPKPAPKPESKPADPGKDDDEDF